MSVVYANRIKGSQVYWTIPRRTLATYKPQYICDNDQQVSEMISFMQ